MAYRRTDRVLRRLAERHAAIVEAAQEAAAEGGIAAVQIVPLAERAGIAAGTVYRYFPAKIDLVAALVAAVCEQEVGAMRQAAERAPGPLSALAAVLATLATRALARRRLMWAILAEPIDAESDEIRRRCRERLVAELELRLKAAIAAGHLPTQNTAITAPALVGCMLEGIVGPLAPAALEEAGHRRDAVQTITLLALRASGLIDARARGLVVQVSIPQDEGTAA
jgi:AcrR family transcriptional regulator